MTTLALRVEIRLGTSIENAAVDLVAAAVRFDMGVVAKLNGIDVQARPSSKPEELVASWNHTCQARAGTSGSGGGR